MNMKNETLSKIFGVLSNPTRLRIYTLILECACEPDTNSEKATNCIKTISTKLKLNQPTVSNHIKELVNAGLVVVRKSGKHSYLYGVRKSSLLLFQFGSQVENEVKLSTKSA